MFRSGAELSLQRPHLQYLQLWRQGKEEEVSPPVDFHKPADLLLHLSAPSTRVSQEIRDHITKIRSFLFQADSINTSKPEAGDGAPGPPRQTPQLANIRGPSHAGAGLGIFLPWLGHEHHLLRSPSLWCQLEPNIHQGQTSQQSLSSNPHKSHISQGQWHEPFRR